MGRNKKDNTGQVPGAEKPSALAVPESIKKVFGYFPHVQAVWYDESGKYWLHEKQGVSVVTRDMVDNADENDDDAPQQ